MATSREDGVGLNDSDFGIELDCNDNSPQLGLSHSQEGSNQVSGESSPNAMCKAGVGVGGIRRGSTSVVSDVNTNGQLTPQGVGVGAGGITLSTEDTINNDFFFDDEFTVPFDANITDAQTENDFNNGASQMIDSAEIDAIIKRGSKKNGLSSSKSDSCLYQADIEISVGSEVCDQNMSQEMTPSEKYISSSDMSDNLQSVRLFSPPNEQNSINGASESDINNSFLSAEGKFDFDWKATKDQYMISFDKNLAKYSSEESSFCEGTGTPAGRVLTTWAIQREGSAWDSQSSGSYSSSKKSSSNNIPHEMQNNSKRLSKFDKQLRKKLEKTKAERMAAPDKESSPAMTTWKAVTSPTQSNSNSDSAKSEDDVPLWKCVKTSCEERNEGSSDIQKQPRSASLPNMKYGTKLKCVFSMQEGTEKSNKSSASSDYKTCSEGHEIKVCPNSDEYGDGESSSSNSRPTSLLELFQKSKSHSGSECSNTSEHYQRNNLLSPCETAAGIIDIYKEAMVSPNSMRRLTGTWSMSTISSGRRSQVVLSPDKDDELDPNISLKRWGTAQNLPDLSEDLNPDSDQDFLSGSEADLSVSGHSISSTHEPPTNPPKCYLGHCSCELSGCLECSGQAGSGYMTDSYSADSKLDHSVQWPPCTCNTSIQTSLEYPGGNAVNNQNYKVVDTSLQTNLKGGNGKPYSSRVSKMYSTPAVKKSPKDARNRLSHSMFSQKSALPDLSFLNNLSVTASGVLRATMSSPNLRQNNTKSCQTSITEPSPSLARRFQKRSVSTSPCSSRESSPSTTHLRRPRSNSISTNTSACSSSSSGIDPGYSSCDSQLNKMAHWFGDVPEHLISQIPEWLVHRIAYSERSLCVVCRVKLLQGALSKDSIASVNSSQLDNDTSQQSIAGYMDDRYKKAKGITSNRNSTKPQNPRDAFTSNLENNTALVSASEEVKLRNKSNINGERKEGRPQSVPDMELLFDESVVRRPLKSCLRRNPGEKKRVAMKHRSWSDPFDATVLRYSQDGETRYQLVTNLQGKPCWPGELNNSSNQKPYSSARDSVEFHKTHHPITTSASTNQSCKLELASNNCCCSMEHENSGPGMKKLLIPTTCTGKGGNQGSNCCPASSASSSNTSQSNSDDASGETVVEREELLNEEELVEMKISPDKIPIPPCACGTSHAVLHSSSDSGETHGDSTNAKKSVKFAEKVFYHSPNSSPHQSPKRQIVTGIERRFPLSREMMYKIQDIGIDQGNASEQHQNSDLTNNSPPPGEFLLSNPMKILSSSGSTLLELEQQILMQKKAMVLDVTRAAELLLLEFTKAKDAQQLEKLASTRDNTQIGHLILKTLCPVIVAIITDDVNPSVRSLFGRVKNTPWRLVEELVEQGNSSRVLCHLVKDLQNLEFLDTAWLKFNAFIFGLLNHRALDFWLTYMCNNEKFIVNNYQATSFISLSQSTARQQFLDMMTSLQPLAKIPFRLEYNFEYKHIKASENEVLSNMLLEKHTTSSMDARLEQLLQHQQQQQPSGQEKGISRQLSADEALSQSGRSSPLRDSIQEMMSGTLKQYSPAIQHTKERTKTLLMVTGQQIKDKFKKIQKQNKTGSDGVGSFDAVSIGNAQGAAKPKVVAPMKAAHLNGIYDKDNQVVNSRVIIPESFNLASVQALLLNQPSAKDDTAILSNTVQEVLPRSRSLDVIPDRKDTDVIMGESPRLTRSAKQSSLSDLVNYFGKKLFSFTSATPPPKPPRTYKSEINGYNCESESNQLGSSSGNCDAGTSSSKQRGNYYVNVVESDVSRDSTLDSRSASTPSMNTEVNSCNNTSDSDMCSSQQLEQSNISCNSSSVSSAPPVEFYVPSESSTTSAVSSVCSVNSNQPKQEQHSETSHNFTAAKILNPSANPVRQDSNIGKTMDSNISKTANFFKKKFGPTLINVFDKLLLDKKGPGTFNTSSLPRPKSQHNVKSCDKDIVEECSDVTTTIVKRSVSAVEFPRRQVQALCSYVATESDELSFNKGSLLSVLKEIDDDWLLCNSGNNKGLVHQGCVKELSAT